jgi:DNA replication protein DnaC
MKSEDPQLAEVAADFDRRRAEETPRGPSGVVFRPIPPAMTEVQADAVAQREAAYAKKQADNQARANLAKLIQLRGDRYAKCGLDNFATDGHALPTQAVATLRIYCQNITKHAAEGVGVFLFGPCGTGKDHLAMGVAKAFIQATRQQVSWASGAMLFEQLRDSFDGKKTEGEVMGPHLKAPLLWISDPLPVRGELTQYQAEALYRLVDARYNARRPIVMTANIEPGTADLTLGPAISRRLRESMIRVHCNWPPFRSPVNV